MKRVVKHFSATQVNNLSLKDAMDMYKPVTEYVANLKESIVHTTVVDQSVGLIVDITFDPKLKEIYLSPASDSKVNFPSKLFKTKWEPGNIFFQLVMASVDITRNQSKLSTTQKTTYVLEDILHQLQNS